MRRVRKYSGRVRALCKPWVRTECFRVVPVVLEVRLARIDGTVAAGAVTARAGLLVLAAAPKAPSAHVGNKTNAGKQSAVVFRGHD